MTPLVINSSRDYGKSYDRQPTPGSLRKALTTPGDRSIVFDGVSEIHDPKVTRAMEIVGPGKVSIDGGNGVTLRGKSLLCRTVADTTISNMRFRVGARYDRPCGIVLAAEGGSFRATHCTIQDQDNEAQGGYCREQELTYCIIGPGVEHPPQGKYVAEYYSHGTLTEIQDPTGHAMYDRCLYVNQMRQGSVAAGLAEWRHCVIFIRNCGAEIDYPEAFRKRGSLPPRANWIGNVFIIARDHRGQNWPYSSEVPIAVSAPPEPGAIYAADNWVLDLRKPRPTFEPVVVRGVRNTPVKPELFRDTPHDWKGRVDVPARKPTHVLADVLLRAGCWVRDDQEREAVARVIGELVGG